jgi:DNA-binding transcriptional LysR family regulator
MELRHLRYFIAVAEELHFGRAAERLHISQPPLSQQIQALEAELAVTLLDRSRRQVRLTPAGTAFLGSARQILASVDLAVRQAREAEHGKTGTLRVAHIAGASLTLLPGAINLHRQRFPEVTVDCQLIETAIAQPEALRSGTADLGIVRLPFNADGLVVEELGSEPMVLAVPTKHALARQREVTWAQLRGVPFVWYPRHLAPALYDEQVSYMARKGLELQVAIEAPHFLTILAYVAAGLGVSIVLESATALMRDGVRYVRIRSPLRVGTGIAYRAEAYGELAQAFVASLRQSYKDRRAKL